MQRRLLSGTYECSLDNRFRFAIPARLREAFAGGATVSWWIDDCLAVVPTLEWDELVGRTFGDMSPQLSLVQGSLNKPCVGLPAKLNAQGLLGVVAVGVLQDVPILSAPQNQQCVENSTQAKGDEPLSHILDDLALLSGNGVGNE